MAIGIFGNEKMHALIVDDESIARDMVKSALEGSGFACMTARDGAEAMELLANHSFDLVVTDLCMPNTNGHALVRKLLSGTVIPLIVVHSCVADPRITTMLMNLGVDDILYKPSNYAGFAAKMNVLVNRRRQRQAGLMATEDLPALLQPDDGSPESSTAIDAFVISQMDCTDNQELTTSVLQDKALAEQVLKLANSPAYNRSDREILDIREAIARLGRKRISEVALQQIEG